MPTCFATASLGYEDLLGQELTALGAGNIHLARAGVSFNGELEVIYRVCLWSRLASRILLQLKEVPATDAETLYEAVKTIDWAAHIGDEASMAVDFLGSNREINNTQFGAQKVKDAVVDQLRDSRGRRPQVDADNPDVRVNVYLHRDNASISIDLSGNSLHRRGYRTEQGQASLKETLAAAILLRADWPAIAAAGGSLRDPLCGSGTLLIEAALMAADIAPGLLRQHYGFQGWLQHDPKLWEQLINEAEKRRDAGLGKLPPIQGTDHDPGMIRIARANARRAGLEQAIDIRACELDDCQPAKEGETGLLVTNPPYGERLGETASLPMLYRALGLMMKRCHPGWRAAIFTGEPDYSRYLGMRAHKTHALHNGPLKCRLLHCEISAQSTGVTTVAADFTNRLRKNLKHYERWAERENVHCYRVYDADLPEYNLAIDIYNGDQCRIHVQEYAPPANIDERKAQARLNAALGVITELTGVRSSNLYFKQRRRQREGHQYEKLGGRGEQHEIEENGHRFLVNFTDYLDTGLFLDHRPIRQYIEEQANGKRFLNLFAYTGTATVSAASGGADTSVSVDLSRTYLDWARNNLKLNKLDGEQHAFIQQDVGEWLKTNRKREFDLIFLDPPSFSRSKRMQGTLDVQRDHAKLIQNAMALLAPDGELLFSTNLRRFKLDETELQAYSIEDITRRTIPEDFSRNQRIHQCFRITHKTA